ncbi:hypothetical protein P7K49_013644 [Saguinus oedipus]|uniref:Uncharacterized protein n=1 Tax=Saguinus oedipus TaxID=9490 RepID=A0ABQ9VGI7_SAGOE|nr:hypothetical protein P7K49_013644 [Saguinus oedipus]
MTKLSAQVKGSLNITTPGLQIWRIEAMQMVPVPSSTFGSFFDGDCYIILAVSRGRGGAEQRAKPTVVSGRKHRLGAMGCAGLASPQDRIYWVCSSGHPRGGFTEVRGSPYP